MNVTGERPRKLRRVLTVSLLGALFGGLVLSGLVRTAEAKLIFFPYRGEDRNPAELGIPYSVVRVETSDGERLVAWQLEPERPVADVVYFHGNGGNLSVWLPVLATLSRFQVRVLAVDYRGYGLSTGSPSEEGLYRDAEAVVRHVQRARAGSAGPPLVYWGRSLGGPVAASAARVAPPDGLVLESTFATKAAVIRRQPVLRALNAFSTYRFDTAAMLRSFDRPVLVIHGTRDSIIPFRLGRELYDQLSAPKRFLAVDGADHNDFFDATHDPYWEPILTFIRQPAAP